MRRSICLLALGAAICLLVACKPKLNSGVYELVKPSELDCSAELSGRVSWSADGKIDGAIDELICGGKSIELKSKEVKGGSLVTRDFGTVLIKPGNAAAFTMQLWMTREQKESIRKWIRRQ